MSPIASNTTDEELIRQVDNTPTATPLERELAKRLHEALIELSATLDPQE